MKEYFPDLYAKLFLGLFLVSVCSGCHEKNSEVNNYFTEQELDKVMSQIISKMDKNINQALLNSGSHSVFSHKYLSRNATVRLERIYQGEDSNYYFLIIRPAGNDKDYKRGVGGTFSLDKEHHILHYREVFCTPRLSLDEIETRANYVYKEMISKKSIEHLMGMKHYIEWPDSNLIYNELESAWVRKTINN